VLKACTGRRGWGALRNVSDLIGYQTSNPTPKQVIDQLVNPNSPVENFKKALEDSAKLAVKTVMVTKMIDDPSGKTTTQPYGSGGPDVPYPAQIEVEEETKQYYCPLTADDWSRVATAAIQDFAKLNLLLNNSDFKKALPDVIPMIYDRGNLNLLFLSIPSEHFSAAFDKLNALEQVTPGKKQPQPIPNDLKRDYTIHLAFAMAAETALKEVIKAYNAKYSGLSLTRLMKNKDTRINELQSLNECLSSIKDATQIPRPLEDIAKMFTKHFTVGEKKDDFLNNLILKVIKENEALKAFYGLKHPKIWAALNNPKLTPTERDTLVENIVSKSALSQEHKPAREEKVVTPTPQAITEKVKTSPDPKVQAGPIDQRRVSSDVPQPPQTPVENPKSQEHNQEAQQQGPGFRRGSR